MRFADLDAVTLDAFGTLLTLIDPVPVLIESLRERGIEARAEQVTEGFAAEGEYYKPRSIEGRGEESLARLRFDCTGVLLRAAGIHLDPAEVVDADIEALRFELLPGAAGAGASLRPRGPPPPGGGKWGITPPDHPAPARARG